MGTWLDFKRRHRRPAILFRGSISQDPNLAKLAPTWTIFSILIKVILEHRQLEVTMLADILWTRTCAATTEAWMLARASTETSWCSTSHTMTAKACRIKEPRRSEAIKKPRAKASPSNTPVLSYPTSRKEPACLSTQIQPPTIRESCISSRGWRAIKHSWVKCQSIWQWVDPQPISISRESSIIHQWWTTIQNKPSSPKRRTISWAMHRRSINQEVVLDSWTCRHPWASTRVLETSMSTSDCQGKEHIPRMKSMSNCKELVARTTCTCNLWTLNSSHRRCQLIKTISMDQV